MTKANPNPAIAWLLALTVGAASAADIEGGERHTGNPAWMEPPFIDMESDLQTVREQGKTGVMVLYTTLGCSYCAEFVTRSLEDPRLQQKVRDNFVSLGLEIFDDTLMMAPDGSEMSIKQFAEAQGAGMAPTLLFFGPDGNRTLRAVGYQSPERFDLILDYLIEDAHQSVSFRDFALARLQRDLAAYPTLKQDPLFLEPPYALARQPIAADRPMLVLFERTGCADCARLHREVLADEEVRDLLGRFDIVRLDADDDQTPVQAPNGEVTTPAKWFAAEAFTRVPAMLYVDEQGEAVYRNDAFTQKNRLLNMSGLVLDKKYLEGWSYQRYARNRAMQRNLAAQEQQP
jgi:thioredoxin-related protein